MSETFLHGVCPAAYAPYVPESGILQQVHGTESLPQPADPPAQGVQGAGAEGAVLDLENISGKLFGDKGYISKGLFEKLFVDGIQLLTKVRNNMKGALMSVADKILVRKRAIIETVNDELKNMAQIEHSRHRSVANFTVNIVSALSAYCFFPKKPMIAVDRCTSPDPYKQLTLF